MSPTHRITKAQADVDRSRRTHREPDAGHREARRRFAKVSRQTARNLLRSGWNHDFMEVL